MEKGEGKKEIVLVQGPDPQAQYGKAFVAQFCDEEVSTEPRGRDGICFQGM